MKNETTALALTEAATAMELSGDQVALIKRTIAEGFTDDELSLFLWQCHRLGLDPLSRQVYAFKSRGKISIMAGIDGLRAKADETRCYAPGQATEFESKKGGRLLSATAYVKKRVQADTDDAWEWVQVEATAYFVESRRNTPIWQERPRGMLAKCAEAFALRRAFPIQLGGMYTPEEIEGLPPAPPQVADPFAPPAAPIEVAAEVIPSTPETEPETESETEPDAEATRATAAHVAQKREVWECAKGLGLDGAAVTLAMVDLGITEDPKSWEGSTIVNDLCLQLEKNAGLK